MGTEKGHPMTKRMTWTKISNLKRPGYHLDHGEGAAKGLYVVVTAGKHDTSRSWIYRYRSPLHGGKLRDMGLGPCALIGLADARALAVEARRAVKAGIDPIDERRAVRTEARQATLRETASRMTFAQCAEHYLAEHSGSFKNAKHRQQWHSTLGLANKAFGGLNVAAVDTDMIVKLLSPIWQKTPETGSRLRGRIEKVISWASARGFRSGENPARWKGHLNHLLHARPKAEHHSAMPFAEVPAFMTSLRARESISARALEFLILTAARTGEIIGAKWGEIDVKAATWTIPAERMKAGREHVVPLCDRAVALVKALPRDGEYVFAGAREGKPLSNMAMRELLKGMDANGYTPHGFRSAFRDWAGDVSTFDREVIEHALAHNLPSKVEAAYALQKRAKLMQAWAGYCAGIGSAANVTPLRRA
jgi:integrase